MKVWINSGGGEVFNKARGPICCSEKEKPNNLRRVKPLFRSRAADVWNMKADIQTLKLMYTDIHPVYRLVYQNRKWAEPM